MEELLNQPIGDLFQAIGNLLQEAFHTTTAKVLAGVVLWYLTGAFFICRFYASDEFENGKNLMPVEGRSMGLEQFPQNL